MRGVLARVSVAGLLCWRLWGAAIAGSPVLEIETLDRSADPATDLFQFANGAWLKAHPVPADRSRWSSYDEVADRTRTRLRELIERAARAEEAPPGSAARLVADFYKSGMDEAAIETTGLQPLRGELAAIEAVATPDDLAAVLGREHALGVGPLFGIGVDQDAKKSTRYIVQMGQGGLGMPDRDYYLKDDKETVSVRDAYGLHVAKILELTGDTPIEARRHARAILRLETRLARASASKVELRDPERNYHLLHTPDLDRLSPAIRWAAYFKALGLPNPGDLNVGQPSFFRAAGKLVKSEPVEDWKAYLRWHLVDAAAPYLSRAFVEEDFAFHGKILGGAKELQPRWKRVLENIDGGIGEALGQLYVAKYFPPEAKAKVLAMVGRIRTAMRENLEGLQWMSPVTRAKAVEKLDRMNVKIGYPDHWRDYTGLTILPDAYLANTMSCWRFEFRRGLAKLGKPIDRDEWGMTPPTVNAYYNPTMNEMVFPAGVLQPPLYSPDADDASNYGNTGATIGHELTHGFDDEGRQYDGEGNLRDWWTAADAKNFLSRSHAIERQFDAFVPVDNIHVNGKLTAGENIADLGGLKLAFRAMQKSIEASGVSPGLIDGFTPEQRFFIAYAQSFRENIRPEALRVQLATDPHAPGKYRVLGPVANLPEFSAAFAAPAGKAALRPPADRVDIW